MFALNFIIYYKKNNISVGKDITLIIDLTKWFFKLLFFVFFSKESIKISPHNNCHLTKVVLIFLTSFHLYIYISLNLQ